MGLPWSIPAGRMKGEREHFIPLSDPALAVFRLARAKAGESAFVFPGARSKIKPLWNMACLELLKQMGHGDVTVHGFRSSFRDWAGESTSRARAHRTCHEPSTKRQSRGSVRARHHAGTTARLDGRPGRLLCTACASSWRGADSINGCLIHFATAGIRDPRADQSKWTLITFEAYPAPSGAQLSRFFTRMPLKQWLYAWRPATGLVRQTRRPQRANPPDREQTRAMRPSCEHKFAWNGSPTGLPVARWR